MKSVMISIKPKWCELIASGKKTVEVRKTRPKIATPFKCYIYCTEGEALAYPHLNNPCFHFMRTNNGSSYGRKMTVAERNASDYTFANSKVIGEFVCDYIGAIVAVEPLVFGGAKDYFLLRNNKNIMTDTCLSFEDVDKYLDGADGYGWHISDLVIYDEPKELCDFMPSCKYLKDGGSCQWEKIDCDCQKTDFNPDYSVNSVLCLNQMTRPPQSWCYCEETEL